MAVKTVFINEEFHHIFANYNIGDYIKSEPISQGTVQTNYKVQTTEGYFVFRYYENRRKNSVLFEVDLLNFLKENNFPCTSPSINNAGSLVGIHNLKPFAVYYYIEGYHIEEPNEEQKRMVIQTAAELHKITQCYLPIHMESRWNYGVEFCREQAKSASKRSNSLHSKKKFDWINKGLLSLKLPQSLPMGICHCDFHSSNILYHNEKLVALLDFDDANYTYLLFDLVGLIESWAWTYDKYDVINLTEAKKIIEEYTKNRPLRKVEQKHLFDVYKLSILIDSIWFFERGDAEDFYEKRKIDYLDQLGRENFYKALFS
ncbi:homoserine kinase [Fictibacillus fluitans]|uniref:Homoserine kinase n=1 Tax=Fictibacillus fluitans TaxID=3058422 RepID=A0ABT8HX70_9BACL|nr:homoserine kinase [Fictibacillus sp. NE201]MDN4525080.1 homoserine kinase [Fictibacillus sp. NE201]